MQSHELESNAKNKSTIDAGKRGTKTHLIIFFRHISKFFNDLEFSISFGISTFINFNKFSS